ncbi:methyltransferase [uncultured Anaerofustis sp.]|uniref:methyltransferase family protein n=1 Tax=uncultured Anaerofustis sp. TaxID=904996 RepID=UPI0025EBC9E4|nr:methyltransferase [uncultured Anaerofustis sp.]
MGFFLLIPFFLIRFTLLSILNKEAVKRAAYFAPLFNKEKTAYYIYQISNILIIIYLFFLKVKTTPERLFFLGIFIYALGSVLLIISVINFAYPSQNGINQNGIYKISRNPMYLSYFIFFIGCVFITQSLLLLIFVILFIITSHVIIISEERWCINEFGKEYLDYMKKVRRYF